MSGGSPIRLVVKAAQLVDVLVARGETTAAVLAKEIDEPRPSVYRLIAALTQASIVRPTSNGKIEVGTAILRWGDAASNSLVERRSARAEIERLQDETGETTFFCIRRGQQALCVDRIEGRRVGLLILSPGSELPLHAGGAPKAILAFAPDLWEAVLAQEPFTAYTAKTTLSAADLRTDLEAIVARGHSISDEDVTNGVAAIGAPILDRSGGLRGAISAAGLRESILDPSRSIPDAVMAAAARIGADLDPIVP